MAKIALNAAPTFKGKIAIPVAGAAAVEVEFTFKHRTKDALAEHMKQLEANAAASDDLQVVMSSVIGWELDDEFNETNVALLLQNYHGAGRAIIEGYGLHLIRGRLGN